MMNTGYFKSFDGSDIFYREWNFQPNQKTLIIIHRGHEHSERLQDIATDAQFTGYNVFAYDLRGHGYTKEQVSPVFMDNVRDLDMFSKFLHQHYQVKEQDIFVIANSIAGVIVTAWVHDFAPTIAGMALLAPAFEIKLYVPFANEFIGFTTKLKKNLVIQSYVKSKVLTHDKAQQEAYDQDPLISKSINGRLLVDLQSAGKRLVEDAAAISLPTLILSAEKDYVVKNSVQKKFYVDLESTVKEFITLPNFFHGILFESGKQQVYQYIKNFVVKCFELKAPDVSLEPDLFSVKEYENLYYKVMPTVEKLNFAFQKWSLGKIGTLSEGMALGLKYGFDSGISLDYVYHNQAKGKFGIGKVIDKGYLEAIGWRGIRIRKQHLLALLEKNIQDIQSSGRKVKILDIAGGTGNYLFDIKEKYPDVEIVINEFVQSNISLGEKVIQQKGYTQIRFTNYDCFDPNTYQLIDFEPNITIISGIFELFGDNQLTNEAVKGVVAISEENSHLIYTGQPWHPQLKMIAFVLNSHQKKDWVMRRRSQKELDRIMTFNHIKKEDMLIDDYGIFTVSSGKIKG
ncbi:bifunctional alpha/beta hydrolase/class I SAM-dependent methyltransferase [Sphingobacterium sp. SRCM116780]|uniref:bifunctional alpha/beta hydrolase/class I SAM-dependent methyltransferase n=1 Tax=Sphingobacterium sp. SRCM116780 TaxID=2907623 RepID=UPI001F46380B|nr:bifunctional alpha/beta hydrolase/class I SAM-dependent methyltransferase [Sphingobacterium sp. SRCM116780]UIR55498.1 bifunctional alpha/beta hydrolase/class I SAM-dependent methyltransferase [Sphingobacterium sp. SRCM116780]